MNRSINKNKNDNIKIVDKLTDSEYLDLKNILKKNTEIKALSIKKDGINKFDYKKTEKPLPINSITKTIVALLIGISIDLGLIESVDESVDYFDKEVTVRELLTMSSGMDWKEDYLFDSDNWVERVCSREILEDKRGEFQYSGGSSHMLGKIISDRSGMKLEDFADKYLFSPLDIDYRGYKSEAETIEYELTERKWLSNKIWDEDPQGNNIGSFSLRLKPDDLVKIGSLIADYGKRDGKRIVGKDYIEEMIKPLVKAKGFGFYGFQGWIKKIRGKVVYSGIGINNQYMTVVPELKLVIVLLTDSKGENRDYIQNLYINMLMNELAT